MNNTEKTLSSPQLQTLYKELLIGPTDGNPLQYSCLENSTGGGTS